MATRLRWLVIAVVVSATAFATTGVGGAGATSTTTPGTTSTTAKPGNFPLIAPGGLRAILKRERRAARRAPATTVPTLAPTTTTPAIPGTATPYFVGTAFRTFVDPTRGTPARGGAPASSSRTIATTVCYPTTIAPSEQNPKPRVATGPFPLIVFAHGYEIDAASYASLLVDLASGGYVVAAPDFGAPAPHIPAARSAATPCNSPPTCRSSSARSSRSRRNPASSSTR